MCLVGSASYASEPTCRIKFLENLAGCCGLAFEARTVGRRKGGTRSGLPLRRRAVVRPSSLNYGVRKRLLAFAE